ncbi:hypothetical protein OIDMADRAFT_72181, partial [Oidiodendron maius Zn]
ASAQSQNLTSPGCVDVAGFQKCQDAATAATAACLSHADGDLSQTETLACGCTNYVENYNCYASHCWNRASELLVNECEYQTYIVEYLVGCPAAKLPVPYFPTPDNSPDACSCNLGEVYLAINGSIQQGATCSSNASSGDPFQATQEIQGCECCEISAGFSSIYGICPTTDPTLIGLSNVNQLETILDTPFDTCGSYLSEFPCGSKLGFTPVAGGTFYGPDDLPASGTATLSNLGGTVTSPASGAVFTYTNGGDGIAYTISAANVKDSGSGSEPQTTTAGGGSSGNSANTSSSTSTETGSSTGGST